MAAESFTSNGNWRSHPYVLKALGDRAFAAGVNAYVYHTYAHQPYEWKPGFTLFHWGAHFNRHNTWYGLMRAYNDYVARCQYLLRQGGFVADAAYLIGEGAPAYLGSRDELSVPLPEGYDYDGFDASLLHDSYVSEGRLTLPDGMSYQVLVLPDDDRMTVETARAIRRLVAEGVALVGPRPKRAPGLEGYPESDRIIRQIAAEVWGAVDGKTHTENRFGRGRVFWGLAMQEVFARLAVPPDFSAAAAEDAAGHYIHRRLPDAEVYFTANSLYRPEPTRLTFRVKDREPYFWNPDDGSIERAAWYRQDDETVTLPYTFDPAGSVFVVFMKAARPLDAVVDLVGPVRVHPSALRIGDGGIVLEASAPGTYTVKRASGAVSVVDAAEGVSQILLNGPWRVSFPEADCGAGEVVFDALSDWAEHADERIRYFSGTATYTLEFDAPSRFARPTGRLVLDLGDVKDLAVVSLNGASADTLWKAPYRMDVTGRVKPGQNRLQIRVTNSWQNRLVGDQRFPPALPAENARCGQERTTYLTFQPQQPIEGLNPSGLLGPARLESRPVYPLGE